MTEGEPSLSPKEALRTIIGGEPSVIYLMSGGIAKGNNVDFRSTSMLDPDMADGYKFGYLGGALRVHAVGELHRFFPEATIVTSSTVNGISHAAVQERELRALWEKWGIEPPKNLLQEPNSNSTRTELAELIRMIVNNNWQGQVVAVTNDYHIPRTEATLENLPQLITPQDPSFLKVWGKFTLRNDVNLIVQDAETVLNTVSPKFKKMLDRVFLQEPWKSYRETRIKAEENGVKAIRERAYNPQKARE